MDPDGEGGRRGEQGCDVLYDELKLRKINIFVKEMLQIFRGSAPRPRSCAEGTAWSRTPGSF